MVSKSFEKNSSVSGSLPRGVIRSKMPSYDISLAQVVTGRNRRREFNVGRCITVFTRDTHTKFRYEFCTHTCSAL